MAHPGDRPAGAAVVDDDPVAAAIIGYLESLGARRRPHAGGRPLLHHLVETYAIVRRWEQPAWLARAALLHSVYGSEVLGRGVVGLRRRGELKEIAGERAERLAYLFAATPRRLLVTGTYRWARELPSWARPDDEEAKATRDELDALVLVHMANRAEQSRALDGSPVRWLVAVRELGELLHDSPALSPPPFVAALTGLDEEDEEVALRAYRSVAAISEAADGTHGAADALALSAAACPVLAEPCLWLGHLAARRGDAQAATAWAGRARRRLLELGTAWDKRLGFEEWLEVADTLEAAPAPDGDWSLDDPRSLLTAGTRNGRPPGPGAAATDVGPPDPATGRARFHRYVEGLADDGDVLGAVYPELPSRPWYEPEAFPLARALESRADTIRAEILALEHSRFHPESERIGREGSWDVAFFYERGRRRAEICAACPVTAETLEAHPAMRTHAGLIYVSRMRAGTHIHPHRGPTNLRVRLHLGIEIPEGDCALRVGAETRPWQAGRCLIFDDHFEHEAWNHTGADRIVLIADLWHPGLSQAEIMLLGALHEHTLAHARRLGRYWAANAAAARRHDG